VAAVLFLNASIVIFTAPQLLKMLLGIETSFSRSGVWSLFNTTFLSVAVALAWLALDPLVKAVYTLRCFRGEARRNGADLLAELSLVRAGGKALAAAVIVFLTLPGAVRAENGSAPPMVAASSSDSISSPQIEAAVKETLRSDKYAWRLPREKNVEENDTTKAWLRTFFSSIGDTIANWARSLRDLIRDVLQWFRKHFAPRRKSADDGAAHHFEWTGLLRGFAYCLLAVAAVALVLLAARLWRQGWRRPRIIQAEVVPLRPDLNDEAVTAAHLPEDEWLRLAREMLNKGETRLALRALYLATLAHLAGREIVSIARFKSNRDYQAEVSRRARGSPELLAAFSANVSSFDRSWYGLYEVTAEALAQFQSNFERIRSC
jgi:hypothetical protein